ncbi:MAG: PHP domain-containing protein [Dehalococcoidia bacterium]|nr:PHP domain-containing protein [Dehalococcoidia bacterium]
MDIIRVDLHLHTFHSPDSANLPAAIVRTCLRRGLGCIAVTDHNRLGGALEIKALAPFPVIIAEEVKTTEGEIIGLFLKEEISRGLSPEETAKQIRSQGALVMIPHPFDRLRTSCLGEPALLRLVAASLVDIIEVFNSRTSLLADSRRARQFAEKHRLLMGGGSDAHSLREIGQTYVEMAPFEDEKSFLRSLASGRVVGRRSNPSVHLSSMLARMQKRLNRPRSDK